MEWLCYLRSAQALGFTVADIEAGMPLRSDPVDARAELRAAPAAKLEDLGADCPVRPTVRRVDS